MPEGNADRAQGLGHRLRLTVVRRPYLRYLVSPNCTSTENVLVFSRLGVPAVISRQLDLAGKPDLGEQPDAVEVRVHFIPGEAMPRGDGMSVVVIVPALAAADQGDPPVVARI